MSKSSMKNLRKITAIAIMTTIIILLLLALVGRIFNSTDSLVDSSDPVILARSRVKIGDDREDALIALSDAWFHTKCGGEGRIDDLFFYGPRDPERVRVVIITSGDEDGTRTVRFIGSLENYILPLYEHCVPLPADAFKES